MCMTVTSAKLVAQEDLVCWKIIYRNIISNIKENLHGETVEITAYGITTEAIVSIKSNREIYFCTDLNELDGRDVIEKFGKMYSWILDSSITSVIHNGVELLTVDAKGGTTPYQQMVVRFGETYNTRLDQNVEIDEEIDEGFHSFVDEKDAENYEGNSRSILVKCIIPKGSSYYEGEYSSADNFCSDTIRYTKEFRLLQ